MESELRNERFKNEQKESKIRRLARDNQLDKDEIERMNLELMRTNHDFDQRLHRIEKEKRECETQSAEEMQVYRENISQLEHQLDETLDLVKELNHSKQAPAIQSRPTLKVAASDSPRLAMKILETENADLKEQLKAASKGVACLGRAAELERELGVASVNGRRLESQLNTKRLALESSRESATQVGLLQRRISTLTDQRDRLLGTETECNALIAERKEWQSVFHDIVNEELGVSSTFNPLQVLTVLRKFKDMEADFTSKQGQLQVMINTSRMEASRASEHLKEARRNLQELDEKYTTVVSQKQQVADQNEYLQKHCDSLLRAIDQIHKEPFATMSKSQQAENADLEKSHTLLVAELRRNLSEANAKIEQLHSQEYSLSVNTSGRMEEVQKELFSLTSTVEKLQSENDKLQGNKEKLMDRVAELEHHVAVGGFNPEKTKIVHLKMNPEIAAETKLVDELRREIALLKKNPNSSSPMGGEDATIRYERLKAVFRESIKKFKEAVYLVTGVEINMKSTTLVVKSIYAENPDDELVFKWSQEPGEKPVLVPTEYSCSLDENTMAYYTTCKSIPAFLGMLTMDLFGKQTLAMG